MRLSIRQAFVIAAIIIVGLPGTASAHVVLKHAEPARNTTVASPTNISLHFNEAVIGRISSIKVNDSSGKPVVLTATTVEEGQTLVTQPAAPLVAGAYTVTWTTASQDDGHKMSGRFSFTVK